MTPETPEEPKLTIVEAHREYRPQHIGHAEIKTKYTTVIDVTPTDVSSIDTPIEIPKEKLDER